MEPFLWIALGVVLAVAEVFTVTLFLIMFAAGAFAAAGAAALGFGVAAQLAVFASVSAATVAAFWPTIRRHRLTGSGDGTHQFGAQSLEGETALVLDRVDGEHGQVKIDGELWSARSFDDTESYEPGERVRVIKVRGATVYVWREGIGPASRTELED